MRHSLPAAAWIILVTVLLALPGSVFPKQNWLDDIWLDKWVHTGLYSILATLVCFAIYKSKKIITGLFSLFMLAAIFCTMHGVMMEFIQQNFIPNRSFDIMDIAADGLGAGLGTVFSTRRFIKK